MERNEGEFPIVYFFFRCIKHFCDNQAHRATFLCKVCERICQMAPAMAC